MGEEEEKADRGHAILKKPQGGLHGRPLKPETHIDRLTFRMNAIKLLRLAKSCMSYGELSRSLGLPMTVLSQYAKGHVLPNYERALELSKRLLDLLNLRERALGEVSLNEFGYVDYIKLVNNIDLLSLLAIDVEIALAGSRLTCIMPIDSDIIPLSTILADDLNVKMVMAFEARGFHKAGFICKDYIVQGKLMTLYIPRDMITKKDSVLITTSLLTNGLKEKAALEAIERIRANPSGVCALISMGDEWKKALNGVNVHSILSIRRSLGVKPS